MSSLKMWEYWKEKRGGVQEALLYDYPNILKSDDILTAALLQLKMAEIVIEARMAELADIMEDED